VSCFAYTFWASAGIHPGVVAFIVLSGFCIHLPIARNKALADAPGFWSVYWKRRSTRIAPVFVLGCVLGALVITGSHKQEMLEVFGALTATPFVPSTHIPGNPILQTVVVEMWLYAAYPVTLFIYRRYGAGPLISAAVLIHAVAAGAIFGGADPTWAGQSWYAFYLYWVIGMLCAEVLCRRTHQIPMPWIALGFAGYVLFGNLLQLKGTHYVKSLYLAFWTGALLIALCQRVYRVPRLMTRVGEMSYTLYAVHVPLIAFWLHLTTFAGVASQLGFFVFLFGTTIALYWLVERPSHIVAQGFSAAPHLSTVR
jgi:peptidoglycan/LPS O-acetylase OafA/YrhL